MPIDPFAHDIFVSYGQIDDHPVSGMDQGWVTTLVRDLTVLLDQRFGRAGACRIWWDRESLARHGNLTPNIIDALGNTGILLVIYSPAYLASLWCAQERESFLKAVGGADKSADRVFLVEKDRLDLSRRPTGFGDMMAHRFWEEKGDGPRTLGYPATRGDSAYFSAVDRLVRELHQELERLRAAAVESAEAPRAGDDTAPSVHPSLTDEGDVVFLAQATEDLDPQRDQVRDYLCQAGIRVVPDRLYPSGGTAFRESLEKDLAGSRIFAQLLGPLPGRRLEGLDTGYVALQHEAAMAEGKPVIQWRSRDLDPKSIPDAEHRHRLDGETVMAVDLVEFKRAIVQCLEQERRKQEARSRAGENTGAPADAFVFLSNGAADRKQAEDIGEMLARRGYVYASTLIEGGIEELKEDLEANIKECDGLVVVHGNSKIAEIRRRLRDCRTWLSRRDRPVRALALYQGPPPGTKGEVGMRLGNMQLIDCSRGLDEAKLTDFVRALAAEARD